MSQKISKSTYALFVLGFMIILGTCFYGKKLKMDKVIPSAVSEHAWAISVAMSDMLHHLNRGYMFYPEIFETLSKNGMSSEPIYLKNIEKPYPDNVRDPLLMQNAIEKAKDLKINHNKKSLKYRDIRPMVYSDIGFIDYYKAAFKIFGFKLSAPYHFFYVLLALTFSLYMIGFRENLALQIFGIITLSAYFLILLFIKEYNNIELETPFNFRALSILGILPTLHILFLTLKNEPFKMGDTLCLIFQCLFIAFLIAARSSGLWMGIAFILLIMKEQFFWAVKNIFSLKNYKVEKVKCFFIAHYKELTLFFLPLVFTLFIYAHKIVTIFCFSGAGLIKDNSISMTRIVTLCVIWLLFVSVAIYFFKIFQKEVGKRGKNGKVYFSFASFLLPLLAYGLAERITSCAYLTILLTILKFVFIISALYFGYMALRGLELKLDLNFLKTFKKFQTYRYFPIFMFFFIFLSSKAFIMARVHPVYALDDCLPHHLVYHNQYIGLFIHPEFMKKFRPDLLNIEEPLEIDEVAHKTGFKYFEKKWTERGKKEAFRRFCSQYTRSYKMGLYDKCIRKVYYDFVMNHPKFAIKTYLYKIKSLSQMHRQVFVLWIKPLLLFLLLWCALSFIVIFYNIFDLKKIFIAILCMFIASTAPLIYAYPTGHAASDHLLMFGLFNLVLGFGFFNLCLMGMVTLQSRFNQSAS